MSDFVEGVGDLVQGSMAARAVEPNAGDTTGDDGHTHETECLNCGTHLVGSHCHNCGQAAHIHRTIGAIFHDILHGVLHLEGKTWATLPLLAWNPGKLTRRYIDGERASFVSPMAMFLFSIFVMFAVFQIMGISPTTNMGEVAPAEDIALAETQLQKNEKELVETLKQDDLTAAERAEATRKLENTRETLSTLDDLPQIIASDKGAKNQWHSGWKRLDKGIDKWRDNPGLMLYKLQTTAYKFSWLLIPISVPFVALLFLWRRRFGMYDHAVFVTYSIAFMTLMTIALTIASGMGVPGETLFLIFGGVAMVHIYRHIKGTYELSHFSSLWRTVMLFVFIQFIVGLFAAALVMLGLVG